MGGWRKGWRGWEGRTTQNITTFSSHLCRLSFSFLNVSWEQTHVSVCTCASETLEEELWLWAACERQWQRERDRETVWEGCQLEPAEEAVQGCFFWLTHTTQHLILQQHKWEPASSKQRTRFTVWVCGVRRGKRGVQGALVFRVKNTTTYVPRRHMCLSGQRYCRLIVRRLWIYSRVQVCLSGARRFTDQCIKACCFEYQTRLWLAPPAPLCRADCTWSLSSLHNRKCLLRPEQPENRCGAV